MTIIKIFCSRSCVLLAFSAIVLIQCNLHLFKKVKNEQEVESQDVASKITLTANLLAAAERGDLDFFENLTTKDIDFNIQDKYGWSLLLIAAKNHHIGVMKFLLRRGADANHRTSDGISALHLVVPDNNIEIIKELFANGLKIKDEPNGGCDILLNAATHGATDIIKTLLSEGIDIKCRNEIGENILMVLWERNNETEILEFLIAAGAEVNVKNNQGESPLFYQVRANRAAYVATLLKHGAMAQDASNNGTTLLRSALASARASKDFTIYNQLKRFGATH